MFKKNLLISWPSRNFLEVIKPLLNELKINYNIFLLLSDVSTPPELINTLNLLKSESVIKKYYITPPHLKILKNFLFYKKITPELKAFNIDIWLLPTEILPNERYLAERVLPVQCTSVIMWVSMTFLFLYNKNIVQKLLAGEKIPDSSPIREKPLKHNRYFFQRLKKVIKKKDFKIIIIWGINNLLRGIKILLKRMIHLKSRYIYPLLFTGRIFKFGTYDQMTQLGSGRSDAVIFFDSLEAKVHKLLYKNCEVYTAQYPTFRKCNCSSSNFSKKIILSPLSGWEEKNRLSEDVLKLFYRDFRIVISQSGAEGIHLRPHPDFGQNGSWSIQMRDYLIGHGVKASIVDCNEPFRKVACNYIGVAGFGSAALRDARAACNNAFIVGFTAVSKYYFNDPKFGYGNSEGIGWINEDGSYNPQIFERKKHVPPKRKTVPEILNKFLENHIK